MEFSYDSRNRAEVARESGNFVGFRATVFPNVGHGRRLFRIRKQCAAMQLERAFLFEQPAGLLRYYPKAKNGA
ncbi:hypothetical protein J2794_005616 [Paraburkholderia terricola]|uniref:hypothetical protein n=1 Tax=Paraburkholderia terricola TaxID=169427 RepID=UPI0028582E55|nr:hypothetical protein [Paraburkholderia terricola]MDR6449480.1 hypothetical protein [Paraburkholderia terricola]